MYNLESMKQTCTTPSWIPPSLLFVAPKTCFLDAIVRLKFLIEASFPNSLSPLLNVGWEGGDL